MLIAIDGNEANVEKKVGVSVYVLNLLKYFSNWANKNLQFIIYLKNKPLSDLPKENQFFKYQIVKGKFLWSQFFLPLKLVFNKNIDVFFSPAHYSPRFLKIPLVVTIHDLSYLYYPHDFLKKDLYKLKNWTKNSLERAKKIIAVSKTTKKDIINHYHIPEYKIEVIYNGYEKKISPLTSKDKEKTKKWGLIPRKYLLYVGTIQPRKNLSLLIESFSVFSKKFPDFKLAIVGKKGWLYNTIFNQVKNLNLEKKIIFTEYINDQTLAVFYKNAFCFVFPSLYEGFGLPVLESMSFNCPVISSFSSSLPEIGSDACLYFDPKNTNDLVEKLLLLKENYNLRKELIDKGKKRIKEFSWEKCAKETLEVLKKAYENKNN